MHNPLAGYVVSVVGIVALLGLVTGFVPGRSLGDMEPLAGETRQAKGDLPVPSSLLRVPEQSGKGVDAPSFSSSRAPVLEVRDGVVSLRPLGGSLPVKLETTSTALASMLKDLETTGAPRSFSGGRVAFAPELSGSPLDFTESPLRWSDRQQTFELSSKAQERTDKVFEELRQIGGLTASLRRQAEQYSTIVDKYAQRYELEPELVYAIIYTESNFDPYLVSNRSAHGLMQVVPETAGGEVHRWFGKTGKPSSSALFHPETNIRYGTAYMYLLQTRHLSAIDDPQSREYCAIAAYNSGTGGMLKTFGKSRTAAFAAINAMTPEQVRTTLLKRHASRETRAFFSKVLASRDRFSVLS